jgi:transposase
MQNFAPGIGEDKAAITAAITLEWSNGQVEGQVNRLKLRKRQLYGRAKFDLLRQYVLNSP